MVELRGLKVGLCIALLVVISLSSFSRLIVGMLS